MRPSFSRGGPLLADRSTPRRDRPTADRSTRSGRLTAGRSTLRALYLLLAVALAGCAHQRIPNTDVEENDFNRRVIEFCEEYRRAVERRNVGLLLRFAHPRYYEDGGSIDTSDDLDYPGLKGYLDREFKKTMAIRYEIRYRNVGRDAKGNVLVDYTYSASYKVPTTHGEVWRRQVADNRLELVAEGERFRILSGM